MRFTSGLVLLVSALSVAALAPRAKRQTTPPSAGDDSGVIISPSDGTSVTAGDPFDFSVQNSPRYSSICHAPWTPVHVYLLAAKPTTADLNSTFGFSEYLYYFGDYILNLDGIPPPPNDPTAPPPPILTTPNLGTPFSGSTVYIAVVEELSQCDPLEDHADYALDSRALAYTE
ncbi:hypothetical protein PsYK624_142150 [Phanerochaete sordida]|uniref:Uncharacterized protein n=1 Tax=Phanerochaete sordida TaxID=48140 RepID=A0A9P3LK08_9APHY|nr:hypothetical protein PsYK624_142150 [Phanerochaete sordida]